jgi:hypothetical protein
VRHFICALGNTECIVEKQELHKRVAGILKTVGASHTGRIEQPAFCAAVTQHRARAASGQRGQQPCPGVVDRWRPPRTVHNGPCARPDLQPETDTVTRLEMELEPAVWTRHCTEPLPMGTSYLNADGMPGHAGDNLHR